MMLVVVGVTVSDRTGVGFDGVETLIVAEVAPVGKVRLSVVQAMVEVGAVGLQ